VCLVRGFSSSSSLLRTVVDSCLSLTTKMFGEQSLQNVLFDLNTMEEILTEVVLKCDNSHVREGMISFFNFNSGW